MKRLVTTVNYFRPTRLGKSGSKCTPWWFPTLRAEKRGAEDGALNFAVLLTVPNTKGESVSHTERIVERRAHLLTGHDWRS